MVALTPQAIIRGNPASDAHQPIPSELVDWMQEFESLAAGGGLSYANGTLSDLQARTDTNDGEFALVLSTAQEAGVYERKSAAWMKIAGIPALFIESQAAVEAVAASLTAAGHLSDAQAARDLAEKWASEAPDAVVSEGKYSARHYADKSAAHADDMAAMAGYRDIRDFSLLSGLKYTGVGAVSDGDVVRTRFEGFSYTVAEASYAGGCIDYTATGGVKLKPFGNLPFAAGLGVDARLYGILEGDWATASPEVKSANTTALQAALDSFNSVFIPQGNWASHTLQPNQNQSLSGVGMGTVLCTGDHTSIDSIQSGVRISNLKLQGTVGTEGTWGVNATAGERGIILDNVYANGYGGGLIGGGFYIGSLCWGSRLNNCAAEFCGRPAYIFGASTDVNYPRFRRNSGPLELAGGNINLRGGTVEKMRPSDGAVRGDQRASIVLSGQRCVLWNPYCEQSCDGLVTMSGQNCGVNGGFFDGLSGEIDNKSDYGIIEVQGAAVGCFVRDAHARGLDSEAGEGLSVVSVALGAKNTMLMGNVLEPDGGLGPSNYYITDNGDHTLKIGNTYGDTGIVDGFFIGKYGFDRDGVFSGSSAVLQKGQAGIGPSLVLQNDFNDPALGAGAAIYLRGPTASRQAIIRSCSTGSYGRSLDVIFEGQNDDGDSVVERFRLKANSDVVPGQDNIQKLGNSANRWGQVFAGTGTISTSDLVQKQQVGLLDPAECRVAVRLRSLIRKFKFNDAVERKGDDARIHVGVIAQDVKAAFEAEGLEAARYAVFCSDTWMEISGKQVDPDEEGNYPPGVVERTMLGVRYDQLCCFVLAAM